MAFCEECGARLPQGARFCEECGTEVPCSEQVSPTIDKCGQAFHGEIVNDLVHEDVFSGTDWQLKWLAIIADSSDVELGIILTRENALLSHIGAGKEEFQSQLRLFMDEALRRNVKYVYCNLDTCPFYNGEGDVESVVRGLRRIVNVGRPKYLLILGNEKVIDVARWENHARDSDAEVESDLCYSTLDTSSPWNGQIYDFAEVMRVGRLPSCGNEGLVSFSRYFETVLPTGSMAAVKAYGLSARVWEEESNDEYRKVSSGRVDVSPEVTKMDVRGRIPVDANLFFFNLHGSNDTRFWYGQAGCNYPEAFCPSVLSGMNQPYFIGVEACYGARYLGGICEDQSIMLKALRNKCLAFLGSSRIAFGTSRPEGSCADVVIGGYITCLARGCSAGDAYVEGLKRLSLHSEPRDDSDIKTLAEFALYGDPSVRMNAGACPHAMEGLSRGVGASKSLAMPMPNVRRSIRLALAEVNAKIEAVIDDFTAQTLLPELKHLGSSEFEQTVFKVEGTGLMQKMYSIVGGPIARIAKVYFDGNGKIHKALVSK